MWISSTKKEREKWRIYHHSNGKYKYKYTTKPEIDYRKMPPIQISTCENRKKCGQVTARVIVNANKFTYGPQELWDRFLFAKLQWVQILLWKVLFLILMENILMCIFLSQSWINMSFFSLNLTDAMTFTIWLLDEFWVHQRENV